MISDPPSNPTEARIAVRLRRNVKLALLRHEQDARPRALAVFRLSIWLGLLASLGELALKFAQKLPNDPSPGLFRMNRHIFWMVPAVHLFVFVVLGIAAALALRAAPRARLRAIVAPVAFVASLALVLSLRRLHLLACLVIALLLAIRLAWRIEKSWAAFDRLVRRTLPGFALVLAGAVGFSLGPHRPREQAVSAHSLTTVASGPTHPNVLLVVLDTVRADHLSLYGYDRETTPNLARLAGRGIVFNQARSTAPWTLPSHASMMTGRWTHELSAGINHPLDGTHPTLAEFLGSRGYATAGFVGNTTYCGVESGLSRGFAHFEDHDLTVLDTIWNTALGQRILLPLLWPPEKRAGGHPNNYHRESAESLRRSLTTWLQQQGDRPFFAFLNLYDAHNPYIQPAEFRRRFGKREGTVTDLKNLDRWFIQDKSKLSADEIGFVLDAYDDGIAYLDEQLGRLFDDLDRAGRLANTLVIITADHGEELGEHGLYGHASSLYDGEIRVPLLIFPPGERHAGKRVNSQVSLRDLAATVIDLTNQGESPFPGRSVARYWTDGAALEPSPSLTEVDAPVMSPPNQGRSPVFRGPMKAVTFDHFVLIKNGHGKEELYDVEADPRQLNELSGSPRHTPALQQGRESLTELLGSGSEGS